MNTELPRIDRFHLFKNRRLRISLSNGLRGTIDLSSLIRIGGVFKQLEEDHFYYGAQLINDRRAISWPDDNVSLSADGIAADLEASAKYARNPDHPLQRVSEARARKH